MLKKYGHFFPIVVMLPIFIYIMYVNLIEVSKQVTIREDATNHSSYFTSVEVTPQIKALANELQTVQAILDYVTNIPYKIHNYHARKPIDTITRNYGDCDDKSNLLSSLLSALGYQNYIVLVPKHAFVIVNLKKELPDKKAIRFNDEIFYILESTAKGSEIGFELQYTRKEIEAIIDPLAKAVVQTDTINYY